MWQDLIDQKDKWVGGKLIDHGDSIDRMMAVYLKFEFPTETIITDLRLTDQLFTVVGEDFACSGSRDILGLTSVHVENGLAFSGYGGHRWDIVKPEEVKIEPKNVEGV